MPKTIIPFIAHNLYPLSFMDVPAQHYVDGILGVYELNRVELLLDVFAWTYARSCQQYVAVQQHLVPPVTFRLRYRKQSLAVAGADLFGMPTYDHHNRIHTPNRLNRGQSQRWPLCQHEPSDCGARRMLKTCRWARIRCSRARRPRPTALRALP